MTPFTDIIIGLEKYVSQTLSVGGINIRLSGYMNDFFKSVYLLKNVLNVLLNN